MTPYIHEVIKMVQRAYRHYVSIDLHNDGIAHDILLMREDASSGDVYFIAVESLDDVDRDRIRGILGRRGATSMPLWDLMSGITLGNGMNALEYFHQYVKVRTPTGRIMNPSTHRKSVLRTARRAPKYTPKAPQNKTADSTKKAKTEEAPKKRGPGRPRKNT